MHHAHTFCVTSLPPTGQGVVDMIITELCVFEVKKGHGLVLTEIADGVTVEQVWAGVGGLLVRGNAMQRIRYCGSVANEALHLVMLLSFERALQVKQATQAPFTVASPLKTM